jgi:hypothetical protein
VSSGSRIARNRRKRIHAAEQRRHEMSIDGAPLVDAAPPPPDRETDEAAWRAVWSMP